MASVGLSLCCLVGVQVKSSVRGVAPPPAHLGTGQPGWPRRTTLAAALAAADEVLPPAAASSPDDCARAPHAGVDVGQRSPAPMAQAAGVATASTAAPPTLAPPGTLSPASAARPPPPPPSSAAGPQAADGGSGVNKRKRSELEQRPSCLSPARPRSMDGHGEEVSFSCSSSVCGAEHELTPATTER